MQDTLETSVFIASDNTVSNTSLPDTSLSDTAIIEIPIPVNQKESLLSGHLLKTNEIKAQEVQQGGSDWIFLVLLGSLLLFTILQAYSFKRMGELAVAVFSRSAAGLLLRERNLFRDQSFIVLLLIFVISSSLLIIVLARHFVPEAIITENQFQFFGRLILFYLGFIFFKLLLVAISGWIFKTGSTSFEYLHNYFLFSLFGGVLLIPLIFLILYTNSQVFIYVSLGILVLLFIFRVYRSFMIGLTEANFSLYHLFLYLCTLEILPLIVVGKIISLYL